MGSYGRKGVPPRNSHSLYSENWLYRCVKVQSLDIGVIIKYNYLTFPVQKQCTSTFSVPWTKSFKTNHGSTGYHLYVHQVCWGYPKRETPRIAWIIMFCFTGMFRPFSESVPRVRKKKLSFIKPRVNRPRRDGCFFLHCKIFSIWYD